MTGNICKRTKVILGCTVLAVLGLAVLLVLARGYEAQHDTCVPVHQYINPELDCMNVDYAYAQIRESELAVRAYISSRGEAKEATRVSVFFRDIKTKRWYGVNENDMYTPSSLLKLPLAIAYHKVAEIDPSILDHEFVYKEGASQNSREYYRSAPALVVGQSYSIESMIERMLEDSDNDVVSALGSYLQQSVYDKTLRDLDVSIPTTATGGIHTDFVTPKQYGAILRGLYNASYLSPNHAEKILGMLTKSTFKDGLAQGLPEGTMVAHKFGEGTAINEDTNEVIKRELHDCGVIYHPHNPYILCVMTEGKNFEDLAKVIAGISRIVWENTDQEPTAP